MLTLPAGGRGGVGWGEEGGADSIEPFRVVRVGEAAHPGPKKKSFVAQINSSFVDQR